MVRILFVNDVACIINKYKTLSRKRSKNTSIDEFVVDVLSKCNDNEIQICEPFGYIHKMATQPSRDIDNELCNVLAGKNISYQSLSKDDWELAKTACKNEAIKEAIGEQAKEGEDPFE